MATSASLANVPSLADAAAYPALANSGWSTPATPLYGEIAQLDRAFRF